MSRLLNASLGYSVAIRRQVAPRCRRRLQELPPAHARSDPVEHGTEGPPSARGIRPLSCSESKCRLGLPVRPLPPFQIFRSNEDRCYGASQLPVATFTRRAAG